MKNRLSSLSGAKRYATAFALGALSVLAMPPLGLFPILLLTVPGFIWLTQNVALSRGQSFLTGWAFGAGYFIIGFYWISVALFVDISMWWWVLPLSLIVGPCVFGLYYGFIPLLARRFRAHEGIYACAFVALWSIADVARGSLFTGFPWNLPGSAWEYVPIIQQAASVTGLYGLSLLTLFWAAAPALRHEKNVMGMLILSLSMSLSYGAVRMVVTPTTFRPEVVRVVQGNIPQGQKWDNDSEWRNFEKHLKLTAQESPSGYDPAFVVWPETAVAADLALFPQIGHMVASSLPGDAIGIIGNLRIRDEGKSFFNSVSVIDKTDTVLATYDKHHLVPFGEYIPFRKYLGKEDGGGLASAVSGIGEFTPGPGPQTLRIGKLASFSPLICYEVIFPDEAIDRNNRPDWIVNVTNDAWYGRSAGPHQHLSIARARAIEQGLPLVRAANTGISAIIDPLGRVVTRLPLGESGIIESPLPKQTARTVFGVLHNGALAMLLAAFFIPALRRRRV